MSDYNIYSGEGDNPGVIDYSSPIATIVHPTVTHLTGLLSLPAAGLSKTIWYGVRFDDGVVEEQNVFRVDSITVDSAGLDLTGAPNAPEGLAGRQGADASVVIEWVYNSANQGGAPTQFKLYGDNGTGTMDWVTPLATVTYDSDRAYSTTILGLVNDTAYKFGVRSNNAAQELNTSTVTVTADDVAPRHPDAVTATLC